MHERGSLIFLQKWGPLSCFRDFQLIAAADSAEAVANVAFAATVVVAQADAIATVAENAETTETVSIAGTVVVVDSAGIAGTVVADEAAEVKIAKLA